jgi:hypothetical protein
MENAGSPPTKMAGYSAAAACFFDFAFGVSRRAVFRDTFFRSR